MFVGAIWHDQVPKDRNIKKKDSDRNIGIPYILG